jgi:hypothetical protein
VYNLSNTQNVDYIKLAHKMFVEKPERKRPFHDQEADGIICTLWSPKSFCVYQQSRANQIPINHYSPEFTEQPLDGRSKIICRFEPDDWPGIMKRVVECNSTLIL